MKETKKSIIELGKEIGNLKRDRKNKEKYSNGFIPSLEQKQINIRHLGIAYTLKKRKFDLMNKTNLEIREAIKFYKIETKYKDVIRTEISYRIPNIEYIKKYFEGIENEI